MPSSKLESLEGGPPAFSLRPQGASQTKSELSPGRHRACPVEGADKPGSLLTRSPGPESSCLGTRAVPCPVSGSHPGQDPDSGRNPCSNGV